MRGGVTINYHTLNDFRVEHDAALDALFTSLLTALVDKGVISVECVSQDGTRVRASAGSSSFRSGQRLRELHDTMAQHVQEVKRQMDPTVSAQQQRARERAAVEKLQRLEQALDELPSVEAARARWTRGKQRKTAARASTTDPEARVMKIGNQGYAPAYNVQVGTDTKSRAIVGIDVTNEGSDVHQSAPMRQQIERRMAAAEATLGRSVPRMKELLLDGGYADAAEVRTAEEEGVTMYVPPRRRTVKAGDDPTTGVRASDPDHIKQWHERMSTPKALAYKTLRGSTVETINADLKTHRAMNKFVVRGLPKVRCVALLSALANSILTGSMFFVWGSVLRRTQLVCVTLVALALWLGGSQSMAADALLYLSGAVAVGGLIVIIVSARLLVRHIRLRLRPFFPAGSLKFSAYTYFDTVMVYFYVAIDTYFILFHFDKVTTP